MLMVAFMRHLHQEKLLVWEFSTVNKFHNLFQNSLLNPILGYRSSTNHLGKKKLSQKWNQVNLNQDHITGWCCLGSCNFRKTKETQPWTSAR